MVKNSNENLKVNLAIVSALVLLNLIWDKVIFLYIALGLGLISLLFTVLAGLISTYWLKITGFIGNILSALVLGTIFFLFLWPLSILSKPFRSDSLFLKRKTDTYFIKREHTFTKSDLENPW